MKWKKSVQLMRAVLLVFLIFCVSPSTLWAEAETEKRADVKKLLKVSGLYDQMLLMKNNLLETFGSTIAFSYSQIPPAFWDDFNALVGDNEMEQLIDDVARVYEKHMSHDVILKLIEMFETPFWAEWRSKMPMISREAGGAGVEWAQKITQSESFNQKVDRLIAKHKLVLAAEENH